MKFRKQIFAVLCLFLLLCGCQEVSEGGRENMEQYGEKTKHHILIDGGLENSGDKYSQIISS